MYIIYIENVPFCIAKSKDFFLTAEPSVHQPLDISHISAEAAFNAVLELVNAPQKPEGIFVETTFPATYFKRFKAPFKEIIAAGGLVKNTDSNFLLIERLGFWDLPKGKAEKGETFEETALREVEEECGLTNLAIFSPLGITWHTYKLKDEWILKKSVWFYMFYTGNELLKPQTEEGITQCIWANFKTAVELKPLMYPSIRRLFDDPVIHI
ncbi:MAG: NUDIX hydrolase [Luteibaculaceae bacterium]